MPWCVDMIEFERGWGSRTDEILVFDTEPEAKRYSEDYNLHWNNQSVVPDWYIMASLPYFTEKAPIKSRVVSLFGDTANRC